MANGLFSGIWVFRRVFRLLKRLQERIFKYIRENLIYIHNDCHYVNFHEKNSAESAIKIYLIF